MGLTRMAIRIAVPVPKIESFERYLFIGPHADDIEIGAGATVKKLTELGKKVTFLICTDGRFGDTFSGGVKGHDLVLLREKEARRSAEVLGVKDVRFLRFCDGDAYSRRELEKAIAGVIAQVQPDILFAPDPSPVSEHHADHLNVGNAVRKLACFAPYAGIMEKKYGVISAPVRAVAYYMSEKPTVYVKTGNRIQDQMKAIFECHQSQYPPEIPESAALKLYLKLRSLEFGVRNLTGNAEGFRMLTATHMHCLPEAGK